MRGRQAVRGGPDQPKLGAERVLASLPVGVNCVLGDPFQPGQGSNTLAKLKALESARHRGAVALLSKIGAERRALDGIANLDLDVFLFHTVTGLRESPKYTQEEALARYRAACEILPAGRVGIVIRPVIPGQNDDLDRLEPILNAAERGQRTIVARGFRAADWTIRSNAEFMEALARVAAARGLRLFRRTACLAAEARGVACRLHDDVVDEAGVAVAVALGYARLLAGTPSGEAQGDPPARGETAPSLGDLHFIRLLSGLAVQCDAPDRGNQLALLKGPGRVTLDCSSSWFTYANSTPCSVGCSYCECNYRPPLRGEVGCPPSALAAILQGRPT